MAKRRRRQRSECEWRELVAEYQAGGQSIREFCDGHDVGYTSFMAWLQRVERDVGVDGGELKRAPFVELTDVDDKLPTAAPLNGRCGWRLDVNFGCVLRLQMWHSL